LHIVYTARGAKSKTFRQISLALDMLRYRVRISPGLSEGEAFWNLVNRNDVGKHVAGACRTDLVLV
jgi:hypothetical protein